MSKGLLVINCMYIKGFEKKLRGFLKNLTPWKGELNMTCIQEKEKAVKSSLVVIDNRDEPINR